MCAWGGILLSHHEALCAPLPHSLPHARSVVTRSRLISSTSSSTTLETLGGAQKRHGKMMVALRSSNMSPHHTAEGENRRNHAIPVSRRTVRKPHDPSAPPPLLTQVRCGAAPGSAPLPALHVALLEVSHRVAAVVSCPHINQRPLSRPGHTSTIACARRHKAPAALNEGSASKTRPPMPVSNSSQSKGSIDLAAMG